MSLEKLVQLGWYKAEPSSSREITDLLSIVDRSQADLKVEGISDDLRFQAAYNGILTLANIALRANGFRTVYVFDVAQTEGEDLPEFEHNITGEVGAHRDRLITFLAQQNIALEFSEKIAPALGVSYGGKIALLPGQSNAEEFTTLVHETAHELLHKSERRTITTATVRETEAEAVAFIVGQSVGLDMGTASSDYIQMYAGNAALLAESLEVIQRTSAVILAAIQPEEPAQENETLTELAQAS